MDFPPLEIHFFKRFAPKANCPSSTSYRQTAPKLITPYNPKENGVAERKNKSIVEVRKAMIHDQRLLMHLWVEASSIVVYV
jgi:hypothetical protein